MCLYYNEGAIFVDRNKLLLSANASNVETTQVIRQGDPCIPGKMYRVDCNTCKCGLDNALLCTKMACLDKEDITHAQRMYRTKNTKNNTDQHMSLPILPTRKCVPGKIYRKECFKCFCDNNGKAKCSQIDTCKLQGT
jgi:hypothetical protein